MEWRKFLEPEALGLLGYMLLTCHYLRTDHLEIALAYAFIVGAYLKHLKK